MFIVSIQLRLKLWNYHSNLIIVEIILVVRNVLLLHWFHYIWYPLVDSAHYEWEGGKYNGLQDLGYFIGYAFMMESSIAFGSVYMTMCEKISLVDFT